MPARSELDAYFNQWGEVTDLFLPRKNQTTGYISYGRPESADAVILQKEHEIDSKVITADQARSREPIAPQPQPGAIAGAVVPPPSARGKGFGKGVSPGSFYEDNQHYPVARSNSFMSAGAPAQFERQGSAHMQQQQPPPPVQFERQGSPGPSGRIYIPRVPPHILENKARILYDYFSKFGRITDCFVPMDKDHNGKTTGPKGFAFITFEDAMVADAILTDPTITIEGETLTVEAARSKDEKPAPLDRRGSASASSMIYPSRLGQAAPPVETMPGVSSLGGPHGGGPPPPVAHSHSRRGSDLVALSGLHGRHGSPRSRAASTLSSLPLPPGRDMLDDHPDLRDFVPQKPSGELISKELEVEQTKTQVKLLETQMLTATNNNNMMLAQTYQSQVCMMSLHLTTLQAVEQRLGKMYEEEKLEARNAHLEKKRIERERGPAALPAPPHFHRTDSVVSSHGQPMHSLPHPNELNSAINANNSAQNQQPSNNGGRPASHAYGGNLFNISS